MTKHEALRGLPPSLTTREVAVLLRLPQDDVDDAVSQEQLLTSGGCVLTAPLLLELGLAEGVEP